MKTKIVVMLVLIMIVIKLKRRIQATWLVGNKLGERSNQTGEFKAIKLVGVLKGKLSNNYGVCIVLSSTVFTLEQKDGYVPATLFAV